MPCLTISAAADPGWTRCWRSTCASPACAAGARSGWAGRGTWPTGWTRRRRTGPRARSAVTKVPDGARVPREVERGTPRRRRNHRVEVKDEVKGGEDHGGGAQQPQLGGGGRPGDGDGRAPKTPQVKTELKQNCQMDKEIK